MRMKKLRKKGFIGSALTDFYAWLAFIFVIIVFFFLFKFIGGDVNLKIGSETSLVNAGTTLQNFLRIPVEIDIYNDGTVEKITVSELIVFTDFDEEDEKYTLLKEKADRVMEILWNNNIPENICGMYLSIEIDGKDKRISEKYEKGSCGNKIIEKPEALIPVPEGFDKELKANIRAYGKGFGGSGR